eukprot:TRINITY_DN6402_c0_g1_i2.p1 TRINITY_DN6402_c0_g1~~TRINITY_DN6402_c0_g1_i2.p1  ORF type:complete len:562 (-),score=115.30 TRINITY_DN6402_c0_g1_i2:128-1813(-)
MAACLQGSCALVRSGYRGAARSRSSGRLRRRSSGACGRSEADVASPGKLLRCRQVPAEMEAFSAGYVKFLLHEAVQDSIDERVHDIDVESDSDYEGEFGDATTELVKGLVQQKGVETQPGAFADAAAVPQAFPAEPCLRSFDEDVMSLVSDDDDNHRESFYDQVAEFYVKAAVDYATCAPPRVASPAAVAMAPAARTPAPTPDLPLALTEEEQLDLMDVSINGMHEEEEEEEEDQQEVVVEPDIDDFVLDYVCDLIDSGIAHVQTSQGSTSGFLPCAQGLAASSRPPPSPVHHCPSCKAGAVPVEAESLPADCLETTLLAPVSLPASRPAKKDSSSVTAATSPEVSASRPSSSPSSMTKSRRHLVIGGVVRGPALEERAAKDLSRPAASLAAASSSAWRMDLGKEDPGARSSSLARSYETLGAGQFYRMDAEDSLPGSRTGSRAGSPAWCFRRSASTASAMALDLGQATPCTFGSKLGVASAIPPKPLDSFCQDASWPMRKSLSSGALPRHAVSKSSSSSRLPALVGLGSRPASPAARTVAGWTMSLPTRLGQLDRLHYAF